MVLPASTFPLNALISTLLLRSAEDASVATLPTRSVSALESLALQVRLLQARTMFAKRSLSFAPPTMISLETV